MRRTTYLTVTIFSALALIGAGCSNKIAEKVTENAIERSTNSQVDVDVDQNKVSINTNGVAWQAGESVSLPSGFPDDVHVIDGTIKVATTVEENSGYSVTINTAKNATDTKSEYERELAADGWTITGTVSFGATTTISAAKGNRVMSVGIYETDGQVQVYVTTGTSE